ncbi:hypothetical protein M231_01816 [Tremella mesenterica]|uniref:Uncharacterized protein n=1 Tax=Tremella mesenterica TaxID=5217 RepID=A0A4Q1BSN2_TREME|nr:hypothetical protein M231_01816 [Tremella mesenterica]
MDESAATDETDEEDDMDEPVKQAQVLITEETDCDAETDADAERDVEKLEVTEGNDKDEEADGADADVELGHVGGVITGIVPPVGTRPQDALP